MPSKHSPTFLEKRKRSARRRLALSTSTAIIMHVIFAAVMIFGGHLFGDTPEVIEYVAIPVIPASALGLPAVEPSRPEPLVEREPDPPPVSEPEVQPEPISEPPAQDRPVLVDKNADKVPKPTTKRPPNPSPPADQRRGSSSGSSSGTSTADVQGFDDPDFVYGYYLDQMVGRIRSQWQRPVIGGEVSAVISFRIYADGRVSGARIETSSGYGAFDLAALQAVKSASPLPPLPKSYRKSSLGVNLIVR